MMAASKESLSRDAEKAFSAAVKGPMRSMSNEPNQTLALRPDALRCWIVRVRAASQDWSLVELREVGMNNKCRVVTRRSYGFRTYKGVELAMYHTLGRLPEPETAHRFC